MYVTRPPSVACTHNPTISLDWYHQHIHCVYGVHSLASVTCSTHTNAVVCVCMNNRTTPGHSESLHITMRDPRLSFSSRAKKTAKGSPTPPSRQEAVTTLIFACIHCRHTSDVCEYCTQPSVRATVDDVCTHTDIPPEVLQDLARLVPVPGGTPGMGHFDKAKACPHMITRIGSL